MRHKHARMLLRQYGQTSKSIRCDRREENILKLMEMEGGQRSLLSFPAFARGQIGIMGRYCLLWYILWLVLFVWGLKGDGMCSLGDHRTEILLSVMPPFLLLLTAGDISRLFSDCMVELEKTTKYSPEQVFLVHFLSMTVIHFLLIPTGFLLAGNTASLGIRELLLYGYTPMTLAAAVFLELTRNFRGENLRLAGAAAVTMVSFFIALMGTDAARRFWTADIYSPDMLTIWQAVLAAGAGLCVLEIMALRKGWVSYGTGYKKRIKNF